jgi:hypothetical protein
MNLKTVPAIALALAVALLFYVPAVSFASTSMDRPGEGSMPALGGKNVTVTPPGKKTPMQVTSTIPPVVKKMARVTSMPVPTKAKPTMTTRPLARTKAPSEYGWNTTAPQYGGYKGNPGLPDSGNVKYYNGTSPKLPVRMR